MAFKHAAGPHVGLWEEEGRIIRETDKAILFDNGVTREWLAKSKIKVEALKGELFLIFMPDWMAREKRYV